jgi:hypothetical protein
LANVSKKSKYPQEDYVVPVKRDPRNKPPEQTSFNVLCMVDHFIWIVRIKAERSTN